MLYWTWDLKKQQQIQPCINLQQGNVLTVILINGNVTKHEYMYGKCKWYAKQH